jgi:hypothetical protein
MTGVPFMITAWMKDGLRHRGHADADIERMTPEDAHRALLTPDPVMVKEFLETLVAFATGSLAGYPPPGFLQISRKHPDDEDVVPTRFRLDEVDAMASYALVNSRAGFNTYIEGRLVKPGLRGKKRGGLEDTACVFALVVDSDADKGLAWTPPADARPTLVVETSPGNHQYWYFLTEAISATRAKTLGERMRAATGCDSDTGNPTQPFRIPGTVNYPNKAKIDRGRVVTYTRVLSS